MHSTKIAALSLLLFAAPVSAGRAGHSVPSFAAAVASPGRSADNVKLDESRKPAELLQFLGLRKGMDVLDLAGGNG